VLANTIDYLSTLDPASTIERITMTKARGLIDAGPVLDRASERFLSKYARLGFGWYIARQFAHHRMHFPLAMMGRDIWVFRAYLMMLNPYLYFDKHIAEAYHMNYYIKGHPDFGKVLRAMLISVEPGVTPLSHVNQVARDTAVDPRTIEAFEVLFYNILDRREDHGFLGTLIYPETRLVEFDEHYITNSTQADILQRVGYNHRDLDLTKYLAGIGDQTYLKRIAASDDREANLTKFIMGNGLILSHANLLNQRSVGLSRSSTLLAASRQSGSAVEEPAMSSIAPLFNEQFRLATQSSQEGIRQQLIKDAGSFVEV